MAGLLRLSIEAKRLIFLRGVKMKRSPKTIGVFPCCFMVCGNMKREGGQLFHAAFFAERTFLRV